MNTVWQRAWRTATNGGVAAFVLLTLALVACAPFAWRLIHAWWMPAPSAFVAKNDTKDREQQYAAAFDPFVKQLDGRSLFYQPSGPGAVGEVAAEEPEEVDPSAPPPTRYDGPAITAVVLDTVWFNDGQRIKAGSGASGDMEVLSTNGPWDVRVKWRGTEFTVPFFDHDKVIFKDKGATSSAAKAAVAAVQHQPAPAESVAAVPPLNAPEPAASTPPPAASTPTPSPAPGTAPAAPSETPR